MDTTQNTDANNIEPGMAVEASGGDLGEEDVSKPKVAHVVKDSHGNVESIVVTKGVLFKKHLEVPVQRVEQVDQEGTADPANGKVTLNVSGPEIAALTSTGNETLVPENHDDLLDTLQQELPTAEGLREKESSNLIRSAQQAPPTSKTSQQRAQDSSSQRTIAAEDQESPTLDQVGNAAAQLATLSRPDTKPRQKNIFLQLLGPGFLAGMAGNDASAVTAYSVDGATNGNSHLWLLLLSTPLYQAVQFACAKLGRITQKGFAEILREHYSRWVAVPATLILLVANVALVAADLVAVGSGLELVTGIAWYWFVPLVAVLLWYLTVFHNFEAIKKIFLAMSLAFVTYFITAAFSGANWKSVLYSTFVPQITLSFASISSAVALLGATISPYTMFWQVQGEKEEKRTGTTKQKVRGAALDIAMGVISGNLVSFFIIVCTSATLFTHHQQINTAADAARSLAPLVGPFAKYLFAIGLIGAGLVAIPVLLASTSYAVAGTFGWPAGLSKKPWQSEGFYLILSVSLVISLIVSLLRFDPIQLMFWANVLNGVLAPVLVVYLLIIGNNRTIMGKYTLGRITNLGMILTAMLMFAAAILLFYSLLSGHG